MLNNMFSDDDCNSDDDFISASSGFTSSSQSFNSFQPLSDFLESTLVNVPKNFNVIHINAQSIPSSYPEMLASLEHDNIHAILVSETWLRPCLPSTSYSLPGFILIRNDRVDRVGGGVGIYLKANIPFSVLSKSPQPSPADAGEHLLIEVLLSHTRVLLGVYYSPSKNVNYFTSFENLLHGLIPTYNHTILMGDFNTCLHKKDLRSSSLQSIVQSFNLHILPLNSTHHFPNCTPSLLDLMIVSSPNNVATHGQYTADEFSFHDLVFLSYKIRPPKSKPKIVLHRNFGSMNHDSLVDDAKNIDWGPVLNAESVDDQVAIFNSLITQLYDIHAPLRKIKIKHLPAPWLTDEIKSLIHRKAAAKSRYKSRPTDINKDKYIQARNRCNKVCRDAIRRHVHKSIQNENPGKVWKFLKTMGVGKSRSISVPNNLDFDALNQYFSSTSTVSNAVKQSTLNLLSALPTPTGTSFAFIQFTEGDVKKSVMSISSNAVGGDSISRNMLVPILDTILPVLCVIFNESISSEVFPTIWKDAQVIPLPKKPNPTSFSEYRPISILPFLSKVLERLVHTQLNHFLNMQDFHNPYQSGFRPGHSTVSALVKITDDIRKGMDDGGLTVLALLDFSNAFNAVDFDILLGTLRSINISPSVISWFHSYLFGRRQRIRLDDVLSSWCSTHAGVPQGGVLSPLLFAIFINSISQQLISSYHLYADDLQIYSQARLSDLNVAIDTVNADLRKIIHWSNSFGLNVNPTKTQVIIIGSPYMIARVDWATIPQVTFNGIVIPYSETVKNLGVIFDRTLSWEPHLKCISSKLFASGGSLRRLRNFLPTATKIALAQSLLLPILDYADACYLDLNEDQLNKLERLQNYCIRFIFGLRKYDHVSQFRMQLKWLPIRFRRNAHILSLVYNVLFNPSYPRYLKNLFTFWSTAHSLPLRSKHNLSLQSPSAHSQFYGKSFAFQAVQLWNALPVSTRQAPSLAVFKDHVKQIYFSQSSPS